MTYNENQMLCIDNVILKTKQNRNKNKQKRKLRHPEDLILNTEWEQRTRCSCLLLSGQGICFSHGSFVIHVIHGSQGNWPDKGTMCHTILLCCSSNHYELKKQVNDVSPSKKYMNSHVSIMF